MTATHLVFLALAAILALSVIIMKVAKQRHLPQKKTPPDLPTAITPINRAVIDVTYPYKLTQSRHGWMLVNPNDFYMGRAILEYGEYGEAESIFLHSLLSVRPGKVIEIGANIGTHTVSLAKTLASQHRELIAFEPQPFIFQNLCTNLALNAINNVRAWPWACGAKTETVYFPPPDYQAPGNFGAVSMAENGSASEISVPCVRLDDIAGNDTVSLIKIDVEGFELQALQGAVKILTESRPILYVENDRLDNSQLLIEWLWSQNYRLWWHLPFLFNPDNFLGNKENIYADVGSHNMLGVPRELEIRIDGPAEILNSTDHPAKSLLREKS